MRIAIDLDSGKAILAPGVSALLASIEQKRTPLAVLELQFCRGIVVQELPNDATGKIEFKLPGLYDAAPITGASAWVKTGSGQTALYTFSYPLINGVLDRLLGVDSAPATFTANATTHLLTATAHGLQVGDIVHFTSTGTLPAPLLPGTDYFVITPGFDANDFKVSATLGGPEVVITDTGTGTHSFFRTAPDQVSVTLMTDIYWNFGGSDYKSQTLNAIIDNDVTRGGDIIPPNTNILVHDTFWRFGVTVPDNSVGLDGDFYLQTSNWNVWQRTGGVYSVIGSIAGPGYFATSTTSFAIGMGSNAFTTQIGLAYTPGARARATSAANTANWMEGLVTSYSGSTLIILVDKVHGSGTHADWNLNVAGEPGASTPQETTVASSATPTPVASQFGDIYTITALAAAAAFAPPTGTPGQGQRLLVRIKDNGTARALTWDPIYRASSDLALPATTIISKTMYLEFVYNTTDSKWDLFRFLNNF